MDEIKNLTDHFSQVETVKAHNGYFCAVGDVLSIVILGSLCGLRNVNMIHQWAASPRVAAFLSERLGIAKIPCYYWMLCLLKIIDPESLDRHFTRWTRSLLPGGLRGLTLSLDGKAINSTGKMASHATTMHIVSAHVAEIGVTFAQRPCDAKSNEIPAVRELLRTLQIAGCLIVADAMHCQKQTAGQVVEAKADYLLSVKENQPELRRDIADYINDETLRASMDTHASCEKNRGRIEVRTAFATNDTAWLRDRGEWPGLACIGAVNTRTESRKGASDEWHFYISSRELGAKDLLKHARLEWSVETMHWLLDVHFGEDFCRVEDAAVQRSLNIARKTALNCLRVHKDKTAGKIPISKLMFQSLLDPDNIIPILASLENQRENES